MQHKSNNKHCVAKTYRAVVAAVQHAAVERAHLEALGLTAVSCGHVCVCMEGEDRGRGDGRGQSIACCYGAGIAKQWWEHGINGCRTL